MLLLIPDVMKKMLSPLNISLIVVTSFMLFVIGFVISLPEVSPSVAHTNSVNTAGTAKVLPENQPSEITDSERLPAPAKKLQKVLGQTASELQGGDDLDTRIQTLDQRVAELNRELLSRDITVPDVSQTSTPVQNDTVKRLDAIRSYLASKEMNTEAVNTQ